MIGSGGVEEMTPISPGPVDGLAAAHVPCLGGVCAACSCVVRPSRLGRPGRRPREPSRHVHDLPPRAGGHDLGGYERCVAPPGWGTEIDRGRRWVGWRRSVVATTTAETPKALTVYVLYISMYETKLVLEEKTPISPAPVDGLVPALGPRHDLARAACSAVVRSPRAAPCGRRRLDPSRRVRDLHLSAGGHDLDGYECRVARPAWGVEM